ncbi:MAG: RluA family pseudouridine synthase [bacterium]|nr:RluA family pseudouridine synthase [bacterium]
MKIKADTADAGQRLDWFASDKFKLTRNFAKKMIEEGKIIVNGKNSKPSYKLKENDETEFFEEKEEEIILKPENIPLEIIYEDDDLIVLNKQKGLICHPTSRNETHTLVNALLYHTKGKLSDTKDKTRRGIVHRLDKDTSGLMLAAKNNEAHIRLQEDIQTKKTIRKYLAVCHGIIEEDEGIIDKPLVHYLSKTVKMNTSDEGLNAVTLFKVLERFNCATFLELELKTGRTHQIRCHLASLNHPIIGDDLYGAKGYKKGALQNLKTTGQVLMSYYLLFTHPKTNEIMKFEIGEENYHSDLKKTLNLLRSLN